MTGTRTKMVFNHGKHPSIFLHVSPFCPITHTFRKTPFSSLDLDRPSICSKSTSDASWLKNFNEEFRHLSLFDQKSRIRLGGPAFAPRSVPKVAKLAPFPTLDHYLV